MKKVLMLLALAGFVGACSSNSGGGAAPGNNSDAGRDATTAPEAAAATFAVTHSGSFDITGWAGASLTDVMAVEELDARVAAFDELALAIDTFGTMGMAEGRRYEFDRNAQILRLYAGGHSLEVTSAGSTLSAITDDSASEQGQGQMTKEAPRNLNCRLYKEEVKQEEQKTEEQKGEEQKGEQGQDQKGEPVVKDDTKVDQGQTGEQGQTQEQKQEVQEPEAVVVRCEQTITSEQEQGQTQAQVKPESKTEIIHILLNLVPVVETKQEQVVEKVEEKAQEQKQEEKAPVVKD
jgi:hypothetical protein